jgi:hypothetical protein
MEDEIPPYYLRISSTELEAAKLWALDWKRAAHDKSVELIRAQYECLKLRRELSDAQNAYYQLWDDEYGT